MYCQYKESCAKINIIFGLVASKRFPVEVIEIFAMHYFRGYASPVKVIRFINHNPSQCAVTLQWVA